MIYRIIFKIALVVISLDVANASVNQQSLEEALTTVRSVKRDIKNAASAFGINPEHIAGSILAEHALNVDWKDQWQNRAIRQEWSRRLITRSSNMSLVELLESEKVKSNCSDIPRAFNFWYCVIDARYTLSGIIPTNDSYRRFTNEYFNPNGIGSTFGLGQLSPLRALMVTDLVSNRTNISKIDFKNANSRDQLYNDILDPSKVVYYVAATIKQAIEIYQAYGFDISNDMGVVVTLYNIGNETYNAARRKRSGQQPSTNQMGRWAVENADLIKDSIR